MQKDINKKVLSLKSGRRHAFKYLIRDGCDRLFMYGMAIAIGLMPTKKAASISTVAFL